MGMSPDQVLAMPLHDYQAAIYHLNRDRSVEEDEEELSPEDFDEMLVDLSLRKVH